MQIVYQNMVYLYGNRVKTLTLNIMISFE